MTFYNTTSISGKQLENFEHKAEAQEVKILNIYRKSRNGLTASEVFKQYPDRKTPITSIRRAITNLMNDKKLVKTTIKRTGIYGSPETEYQLYTGQMTLFN